jgi:hypothetical protein
MSLSTIFSYQIITNKQFVYINIVDSITGDPANGNNIQVSYSQSLYGNPPQNFSVYIPGQSLQIWLGEYSALNTWKFNTVVTNPDGPPPPVNQCDLVISSINPDKPESSIGARDAQITVSATSSYLPIQYSIDDTTWQSSPTFTGLPGGLITVYCKDANTIGCLVSQSITILTNSNLLISDPSVTINGNISRWNAAFNPIVFTYQRKDFEVITVTKDSLTGNAVVNINGDMSPVVTAYNNNLTIQQNAAAQGVILSNYQNIYIYINAGPYIGVFTIIGASNNSVTINTPYTATGYGFININLLRPYYKMLTQITYLDPLTNTYNAITAVNRPNNQGVTTADISSFLQSIIQAKDAGNYTQVNYCDTNLSASYTIQYAQQYDNYATPGTTTTSPFVSIAAPYYVIYAARQLQSINGGNLADYVPFPSSPAPAKWITDFAQPAYTNSYPFDISFLYSETLAGQQLYYNITMLDINQQPIPGDLVTGALLNEDGSWLLNQDQSKLLIGSQSLSSTPVLYHVGLNRLLINNDFPLNAYYFTIAIFYNDTNNNPVQLTQTQTIRIDHAPDINGVYMRWIGLTGSWNYYRFNYNQEISLDVQNATIIKNFVQNWQTQDSIEEVISKDAGQKMKLMAEDLSVADIKGLQSIKYSPKVQMLINANPVTWQTVVLNTATFSEYETINGQAPFSITFNQPSINIQTQ